VVVVVVQVSLAGSSRVTESLRPPCHSRSSGPSSEWG
jgi:hypothetical protein